MSRRKPFMLKLVNLECSESKQRWFVDSRAGQAAQYWRSRVSLVPRHTMPDIILPTSVCNSQRTRNNHAPIHRARTGLGVRVSKIRSIFAHQWSSGSGWPTAVSHLTVSTDGLSSPQGCCLISNLTESNQVRNCGHAKIGCLLSLDL